MTASSNSLPSPPDTLLEGATLFLDFDGTLVEFASSPDGVKVDRRLSALMARLSESLDGRLAIISGRSAEQIDTLFSAAGVGATAYAIGGSHGLELRWPDGRILSVPRPAQLAEVEAEMDRFVKLHPGVIVERKPFGAALHYRQAPQTGADCRQLATALAEKTGLALQPGNMVFELKAPWADKGTALSFFMSGPEMSGTRPVFLGDDVTDEAAFAAASRMGGAGVLVGPTRETGAAYRLPSVAHTLDWLESACRVLP